MLHGITATLPPRRTHTWLPDAGLDAHPVGTWLLQTGFDLWIRAAYRRAILMPRDFQLAPGSLIVSNHQRDVDGPMLGITLVQRHGLRFRQPAPFYATREDLFREGILARLTVAWPPLVSALLGRVSLAWFFPLGRAEPMRRVREFTLGETLRALVEAGLGDGDDGAVLLNARGRRELGVASAMPLRHILARAQPASLEHWWGLRRLTLPALRAVAPAFRATVDAQLKHFAHRLDAGRAVYFAPEGAISMDGHFGRVRAGMFRLARTTTCAPWIQPMALQYDALAPGRLRVVIHMGERVRANVACSRAAFDATLRALIFRTIPITPSHLLARWLLHGPSRFTRAGLADYLGRSTRALGATHTLDPLLVGARDEGLANQRLRWLERQQLVLRQGATFQRTCVRDAVPGWRTPAAVARYLDNQLADLVPNTARRLPC